MKRLLIAILSLVVILGAGGVMIASDLVAATSVLKDDCDSSGKGSGDCDDDDSSGHGGHDDDDRVDEDEVAAQAARSTPQGEFEIRIIDEQYYPKTLTVEVGQTVTVVNADDDEHTATSTAFDTGTLEPGQSATFIVDTPGTYVFICQFHAEMRGELVVVDSDVGGPQASPAASPVSSPVASPSPAGSASAPKQTETVDISIVDFAFDQSTLTIAAGTTVVWTNTGVSPHTVTGEFGDSGILEPGETFSYTFDEPGIYRYTCQLHPQMVGEIVVE